MMKINILMMKMNLMEDDSQLSVSGSSKGTLVDIGAACCCHQNMIDIGAAYVVIQ